MGFLFLAERQADSKSPKEACKTRKKIKAFLKDAVFCVTLDGFNLHSCYTFSQAEHTQKRSFFLFSAFFTSHDIFQSLFTQEKRHKKPELKKLWSTIFPLGFFLPSTLYLELSRKVTSKHGSSYFERDVSQFSRLPSSSSSPAFSWDTSDCHLFTWS